MYYKIVLNMGRVSVQLSSRPRTDNNMIRIRLGSFLSNDDN